MDSPEEARRELAEISAAYDRIEAKLDKIKKALDEPIAGHS